MAKAQGVSEATVRQIWKLHGLRPHRAFTFKVSRDPPSSWKSPPQHRHQEFIRFLKRINQETPAAMDLHRIVANGAIHKHPHVERWLRRHPRFHLHFTPPPCSWLDWVEPWFGSLTRQRLRRGSLHNVLCVMRPR
jgi:hypothetical protein